MTSNQSFWTLAALLLAIVICASVALNYGSGHLQFPFSMLIHGGWH